MKTISVSTKKVGNIYHAMTANAVSMHKSEIEAVKNLSRGTHGESIVATDKVSGRPVIVPVDALESDGMSVFSMRIGFDIRECMEVA